MGIAAILALVSPLLATVLGVLEAKGTVSSSLTTLIESLTDAGLALFSELKSGSATATQETLDVLAALQQSLAAVQADSSVDPSVVSQVAEATAELDAAINAYSAAQSVTNPATLTPLSPIS